MVMSHAKALATWVLVLGVLVAGAVLICRQAIAESQPTVQPQDKLDPLVAEKQLSKGPKPLDQRKDFFGDPLPDRALFRIGTTRLQHAGWINGVAVSEDGLLLASWGQDNLIRVWDAKDGKPLRNLELSHWGPWALAISPDGKELAAVSRSSPQQKEKGDFRRWDLKTGKQLQQPKDFPQPYDGTVVHVALVCLPGGGHLAAETAEADISLYSPGVPNSGKTLKGHAGRVMSIDFTRDGKTLVSLGDDGTIRFWNTANGKEIKKLPPRNMDDGYLLQGNVAAIAVSPDAKSLAVALPDYSTRLLDATGRELSRLPYLEHWNRPSLAFSPTGKALFTGGDLIHSWDVQTGKEIPIISMPRNAIGALALSPDGKIIAVADNQNHMRLAETATGNILVDVPISCRSGIAFAPDGKHVAVAPADKTIVFWDVAKLRTSKKPFLNEPAAVLKCLGNVNAFVFSPDGKRLATAEEGGVAQIYEVATKQLLLTIKSAGRSVFAVAFSPDGKLLATMGPPDRGNLFAGPHGHHPAIMGKFPPDRGQLVGTNQCVRLWNGLTGKEVAIGDGLRTTCHTVAFHPSGKYLAGLHLPELAKFPPTGGFSGPVNPSPIPVEDRMETIRLWDIASAREKMRFDDPVYRKSVEASMVWIIGRSSAEPAAFSPDGRTFATGGPGGIILFETASGKPRLRLTGHLQGHTGFAFTPDGKTLVSASADSTVLIWDVTGLRTTGKLPGSAEDLWALLADANPELAGQAVWSMVAAPAESLGVLRKHLKPVPASKALIQKLVAELDDQKFAVREKAMRALAQLGPAAEEALTNKLQTRPSLEMTKRIDKLLVLIKTAAPTAEQLQMIRAVEVLQRLDTGAAREHLQELANGAEGAHLTSQAKEALERINR
jgi:WD40 repeat protein